MLPLGVFILVLILLYFSTVLLSPQIHSVITNVIEKQKKPLSILNSIQHLLIYLQQDQTKYFSGLGAFILALWNFFAPDFGDTHGGITLIGALIPSIVLFLNSLILAPSLIDIIPFGNFKEQINKFLEDITPLLGWLTLLTTILHATLYTIPFF